MIYYDKASKSYLALGDKSLGNTYAAATLEYKKPAYKIVKALKTDANSFGYYDEALIEADGSITPKLELTLRAKYNGQYQNLNGIDDLDFSPAIEGVKENSKFQVIKVKRTGVTADNIDFNFVEPVELVIYRTGIYAQY